VAAYWAICEKGTSGAIYNVCTGKTASVRTLVELFQHHAASRKRIRQEKSHSRKNDLSRVCGDNARLLELGWQPRIKLDQSVRDMLEHAQSQ
jgi:GDP-4-dehydro-6-deoxy-D-mannose reductase